MDLSVDGWSAVGTVAAAVVAVIAAGVAVWQAILAKGARDATVIQAVIAQEALELARAQQHQAEAPTFALAIEPPAADRQRWVKPSDRAGCPRSALVRGGAVLLHPQRRCW